jgi:Cu(I)/Ag(I) efflux system membrane fusion protein
MKKLIVAVLLLGVVGLIAWKLLGSKEEKPRDKQKPVPLGKNTGPFNQSFAHLLTEYYTLKESFIASDSVKATTAASAVKKAAELLRIEEIQGDSTNTIKSTAKDYMGTISSAAQALVAGKTLDDKRKQFETIADAMWQLTRTVQYSGEKVYWQYCPMAFDDKGAYWMSNESGIRNPYFGDEMLNCGEIRDSLDYSHK